MFKTLTGFRDFLPEAFAQRLCIFESWRRVARRFGFLEYDGPVLEPLDLYREKSGEEIVGQLFNFQTKGGSEVALRPEMTPTLARYIGAGYQSMRKPVKWFTIAENFRYERPQKGRLRSHFQLNADIFGEDSSASEAELLALLVSVFAEFGLDADSVNVRISDRELWLAFLEMESIAPTQHLSILGVVDKIERVPETKTLEQLRELVGDRAEALLDRIRALCGIYHFEDLREFFSRKESGGEHSDNLESRLLRLEDLFARVDAYGFGSWLRLDLGIVRGLAYYTGVVFEAFEATGEGRALAGGGRYDHLVEKLGGPFVPALGFGLGDVSLGNLLAERGLLPEYAETLDVFVVTGASKGERDASLKLISDLRRTGQIDLALQAQDHAVVHRVFLFDNALAGHDALPFSTDVASLPSASANFFIRKRTPRPSSRSS